MRRTGSLQLIAVSAVGAVLFLWPFVFSDAPPVLLSLSLTLAALAVVVGVEAAARRLDARRFALLATIAAIDSALRLVLVIGVGGFSPVFFLVLIAGYVYGPSFGFLCGATSLLASAVATGGVGPWLPYETIACGWVGMIAGFAGLRRHGPVVLRHVLILAGVGVFTGFVYGALLDVWDWTTFYRGAPAFGWSPGLPLPELLRRFGAFYAATSAVYDSFRAAGNALAVLVLGPPIIAAFARLRSRFSVTVLQGDVTPGITPS